MQLVAAITAIPLLPPIAEQTCLDAPVCLRPVSCTRPPSFPVHHAYVARALACRSYGVSSVSESVSVYLVRTWYTSTSPGHGSRNGWAAAAL